LIGGHKEACKQTPYVDPPYILSHSSHILDGRCNITLLNDSEVGRHAVEHKCDRVGRFGARCQKRSVGERRWAGRVGEL